MVIIITSKHSGKEKAPNLSVTESGEQQVPRMHHRHRASQSQNQGHHEDHQILLKPTAAICDDHGFKSSASEDESPADSES
jgi:protein required for attachment to host cells